MVIIFRGVEKFLRVKFSWKNYTLGGFNEIPIEISFYFFNFSLPTHFAYGDVPGKFYGENF